MKNMVTQAQLAERLGVSRSTLRRYLASDKLPPPHAILGHTKLWNDRWLTTWLSSQQSNAKKAEQAAEFTKVRAEQEQFERENPHIAALNKKIRGTR